MMRRHIAVAVGGMLGVLIHGGVHADTPNTNPTQEEINAWADRIRPGTYEVSSAQLDEKTLQPVGVMQKVLTCLQGGGAALSGTRKIVDEPSLAIVLGQCQIVKARLDADEFGLVGECPGVGSYTRSVLSTGVKRSPDGAGYGIVTLRMVDHKGKAKTMSATGKSYVHVGACDGERAVAAPFSGVPVSELVLKPARSSMGEATAWAPRFRRVSYSFETGSAQEGAAGSPVLIQSEVTAEGGLVHEKVSAGAGVTVEGLAVGAVTLKLRTLIEVAGMVGSNLYVLESLQLKAPPKPAVGALVQFKAAYRENDMAGRVDMRCVFGKTFAAARLHASLDGLAYPVSCRRTHSRGNQASGETRTEEVIFVESLGMMLGISPADLVSAKTGEPTPLKSLVVER